MIVTITGPSGSGKSTLERRLCEHPAFTALVSTTSRERRDYEVEGKHYYFDSRENLQQDIDEGRMVEYTTHSGNIYGLSGRELNAALYKSPAAVLVCDPHGVRQVRQYCARNNLLTYGVFCATPLNVCRNRLAHSRPDRIPYLLDVEMGWVSYTENGSPMYDDVWPNVCFERDPGTQKRLTALVADVLNRIQNQNN